MALAAETYADQRKQKPPPSQDRAAWLQSPMHEQQLFLFSKADRNACVLPLADQPIFRARTRERDEKAFLCCRHCFNFHVSFGQNCLSIFWFVGNAPHI